MKTLILAALACFSSVTAARAGQFDLYGSEAIGFSVLLADALPNSVNMEEKALLDSLINTTCQDPPAQLTVELKLNEVGCFYINPLPGHYECQLLTNTQSATVQGRMALSLFTAIRAAGVEPEGALGHVFAVASNVHCTVDTAQATYCDEVQAQCTLEGWEGEGDR